MFLATPEILAAGTSHGRIAMWKMVVQPSASRSDAKAQWQLQTPTEVDGNVIQLQVLYGGAFCNRMLLLFKLLCVCID